MRTRWMMTMMKDATITKVTVPDSPPTALDMSATVTASLTNEG